jgi:hypothetical protein
MTAVNEPAAAAGAMVAGLATSRPGAPAAVMDRPWLWERLSAGPAAWSVQLGRLTWARLSAGIEHPYGASVTITTETPYVFPKRSCAADLGP